MLHSWWSSLSKETLPWSLMDPKPKSFILNKWKKRVIPSVLANISVSVKPFATHYLILMLGLCFPGSIVSCVPWDFAVAFSTVGGDFTCVL